MSGVWVAATGFTQGVDCGNCKVPKLTIEIFPLSTHYPIDKAFKSSIIDTRTRSIWFFLLPIFLGFILRIEPASRVWLPFATLLARRSSFLFREFIGLIQKVATDFELIAPNCNVLMFFFAYLYRISSQDALLFMDTDSSLTSVHSHTLLSFYRGRCYTVKVVVALGLFSRSIQAREFCHAVRENCWENCRILIVGSSAC